jgi:glycosyltransferase involved in cell wall biosynthesis
MKINFICLDLGNNGGTKDIFEFARVLTEFGHEVNVIYPSWVFPNPLNYSHHFIPFFGSKILRIFRELSGNNPSDRIRFPGVNVIKVPRISDEYIPDADFVFATWWETAYYVRKLSPKKGRKCYLIQHYEVWGGRKSRVEATYKMGFLNIVHSGWLADKLLKIGVEADAIIPHSPDKTVFRVKKAIKKQYANNSAIFILMPYRREFWKGGSVGIKAFKKALSVCKDKNVALITVGMSKNRDNFIPITYQGFCDPEEMSRLYNGCDFFVHPSFEEGFGLMPFESACCGCPVISTDVGAVPDFFFDEKDALIVPPGDVDALATCMVRLIRDDKLRKKLSSNALETVKGVSWNKSARMLEKLLEAQK